MTFPNRLACAKPCAARPMAGRMHNGKAGFYLMKIVSFETNNGARLGVVEGDSVVPQTTFHFTIKNRKGK